MGFSSGPTGAHNESTEVAGGARVPCRRSVGACFASGEGISCGVFETTAPSASGAGSGLGRGTGGEVFPPGHSAVLAPLGGRRVDSIGEGLAPLSNAQLIGRGQPSPLPSTSEVDVEAARTWLAESQASSSGEVFPTILLHMGH